MRFALGFGFGYGEEVEGFPLVERLEGSKMEEGGRTDERAMAGELELGRRGGWIKVRQESELRESPAALSSWWITWL